MNTMNETARVEKTVGENKDVQCCKKYNRVWRFDRHWAKQIFENGKRGSYLPQKVSSNSILFFKDFFMCGENWGKFEVVFGYASFNDFTCQI